MLGLIQLLVKFGALLQVEMMQPISSMFLMRLISHDKLNSVRKAEAEKG